MGTLTAVAYRAEAIEKRKIKFLNKPLTAREAEIAKLICDGLVEKDIAEKLCLSARTVTTHKYKVFLKLGVHSTVQLFNKLIGNPEITISQHAEVGALITHIIRIEGKLDNLIKEMYEKNSNIPTN